jgi:hypothetical protein
VPLQELQIYGLWAGKQTAKGTKNAAPAKRFKQVAGGFNVPRDDGSENYSDASQFTDTLDWINTLVGNGNPGVHCTPEEAGWLWWAMHGGETTTAVTGPPAKTKHTTVPLPGLGHWLTWVQRLGSSTIDRSSHNDCQIGQMVVEGSTANKAVRMTPTVISLDPGEKIAADPAAVMPPKPGMLYTDGTGRFTIDSTVFRGHSQFTLTVNKDLQPVYSDDVVVYDLAIGTAVVTIGVTLYFDTDGLAQWNKLLYGTAAPVAGTKPIKSLPALGSYLFDLRARDAAGAVNGDKFVLTMAGVKWAVPDAPDPNPDGGAGEVALAGAMRKVGGSPAFQVDIDNDSAAYTV